MRLALLGLALLLPAGAAASAWTRPAGELWLKIGGLYSFSDRYYAEGPATLPSGREVGAGDERPYDDEGITRQRLLLVEAEYGLHERLTLGVLLPWADLRFEDRVRVTDSWGPADLRLRSRVALLTGADRLAAAVEWKLPTGGASTNPDLIPVSEGQADLTLQLHYGRSLGRPLSWLGATAGHRWRAEDDDPQRQRNPGEEWLYRAELGHALRPGGRLAAKLAVDGVVGGETTTVAFGPVRNLERHYHRIELGLLWSAGAAGLWELLLQEPFAGRSYPAGRVWGLSVSWAVAP